MFTKRLKLDHSEEELAHFGELNYLKSCILASETVDTFSAVSVRLLCILTKIIISKHRVCEY